MNKTDFIKNVADRADMSQKEVTKVLDAFQDALLEDVIAKEDSVRLRMGTFSGYTKITKDRKARNPKSGEEILVKGSTTKGYPKLKWSKVAKE